MMKFDMDKFNGINDFNLLRINMCTLLVQQDFFMVLKGLDNSPMGDEWWRETLYMTKSLMNRLYLKHWLYTLYMKEGMSN